MSYDGFRTDTDLETKGVWMDYGLGFRVLLARAGGTNKRYAKAVEVKAKPLRRALQTGVLSKEAGDDIMRDIFAETVILSWEVEVVDEKTGKKTWKKGVEDPDTQEILKAEPDTYRRVLAHRELRDLFQAVQDDASGIAIFLKDARAAEAKNS